MKSPRPTREELLAAAGEGRFRPAWVAVLGVGAYRSAYFASCGLPSKARGCRMASRRVGYCEYS